MPNFQDDNVYKKLTPTEIRQTAKRILRRADLPHQKWGVNNMRDYKTGARFPSPDYPTANPSYVVDRWGVVLRVSKAESAIARRIVTPAKFQEVRHAS